MTTYPWPPELRAVGLQFDLLGQVVQGPLSLVQSSQVASVNGGYWVATLADIHIVGREAMLAYRRIRGLMQGGAHSVLVPVCDRGNAPWPGTERSAYAPFSDTATFSDGSMFSQSVISVEVVEDAAAMSTRLVVGLTNIGAVVGGEYFSINGHLYQVVQVLDEAPPSGADAVWQITPPLREALDGGEHLEFDSPVCKMRIITETQMSLMTFRHKTGSLNPTLVEVFEVEA